MNEVQTTLEIQGPDLSDSAPAAAKRLRDALAAELPELTLAGVERIGRRGQGLPPALVDEVRCRVEGERWPDFLFLRSGRPAALVRGVAATRVNAARPVREWHLQAEAYEFLLAVDNVARSMEREPGEPWGEVVLVLDDRTAVTLADLREGPDFEGTRSGHSRHVAIRQGVGAPMAEVLG